MDWNELPQASTYTKLGRCKDGQLFDNVFGIIPRRITLQRETNYMGYLTPPHLRKIKLLFTQRVFL